MTVFNFGISLNRGNLAVAEIAGNDFAAVDHHLFHERVAHAHHHAAIDLGLMHQRVENRAGAVRGGELFELDLTGFRVDLDLGNLNAQRGFGAGLKILVKTMTLDRRFRSCAQCHRSSCARPTRRIRRRRRSSRSASLATPEFRCSQRRSIDLWRAPPPSGSHCRKYACRGSRRFRCRDRLRWCRGWRRGLFRAELVSSSAATSRIAVCVPAPWSSIAVETVTSPCVIDSNQRVAFTAQRQPLRDGHAATGMFPFRLAITGNAYRLVDDLVALDMRHRMADRRDIAVAHQVNFSERHRIHFQLAGDEIHLRFVGEKSLRIARRAHVAAGNFVGVDDFLFDKDVGNIIRSGGFLRTDQITLGFECAIGAAIENIFHFMRDQPAVFS